MKKLLEQYKPCYYDLKSVFKNIVFFTTPTGEKMFSNHLQYKEHLYVKKGESIKQNYLPFFKRFCIRKDIVLVEYPHPMCFCVGSNYPLTSQSHAAIFMSEGLHDLDPNAFSFLLKHEMAHIKSGDLFLRGVIVLLAVIFSAFLFSSFIPLWSALFTSFFLLPITWTFLGAAWMRFREYEADRFALKHSSVEEIKGAIRYFSACKQFNASLSVLLPHFYTPEGELVNGLPYPKLATRITRYQNTIQQLGSSFYQPSQSELASHIALFKKNDDIQKTIREKLQN